MDEYNYESFSKELFDADLHFHGGPAPAKLAPDFDLPTVDGEGFRLKDYEGRRSVLVVFASITCPMTAGALPALRHLHRDFGERIKFVTVYVREAHPGECYPHHTSEVQKLRHAGDWVREDEIPVTVAVDTLEGRTHRLYGALPNSAYLIDQSGRVAFRALWAGQESLLRSKIAELLLREKQGAQSANLGQQENLLIPMIHGAAEFDHAVARGGEKATEDFRREMGMMTYGLQKLMSAIQPAINPGNRVSEVCGEKSPVGVETE